MSFLLDDPWMKVDRNLHSVRTRLQTSDNEEDFQTVGLLCRETIVSLGRAMLVLEFKGSLPETSGTDAKEILSAYFDKELPGSGNKALRSFAKSCLVLANDVAHRPNASYLHSELCTEACVRAFEANPKGFVDAHRRRGIAKTRCTGQH